jgi:carbon-monoxide dehydrogenase medium subunit/xanthine dehydrogenase FAD-binding subunit
MRFDRVEEVLAGSEMTPALRAEAGAALAREMVAASGVRWSTPYKEPVVAALLGRALEEAWRRAGGEGT